MSTRIAISGYYGFGNTGDEAILAAMIDSLRSITPDVEIVVLSQCPEITRQTYGVEAVSRYNFKKVVVTLRTVDLLISGGGGLYQDVTSSRSLYYYLGILLLARLLRKPVMLYGVGIGPLRSGRNRNLTRRVLNWVQWITVRDRESALDLQTLGVQGPPIHITVDPVFGFTPPEPKLGRKLWQRHGIGEDTRLLVLCVRSWGEENNYRQVIAKAADDLCDLLGLEPVFLAMQVPEDVLAGKEMSQRMSRKARVIESAFSPNEIMAMIGESELLIAMRYHALIFGLLTKVPLVGIAYDPKVSHLAEQAHFPCEVLTSEMTAQAVVTKGLESHGNRERLSNSFGSFDSEMSARARKTAEEAVALVQDRD